RACFGLLRFPSHPRPARPFRLARARHFRARRLMADEATREHVTKQRWAEPGSGHDQLVRWFKIVLPVAVGVLVAILALAPLEKKGDVSFILDKKKVQNAPERMRVEAARYTGTDDKGQQFVMVANRAVQRS